MAWFRRDPRIRWVDVDERGAMAASGPIMEYLVGSVGGRVTDELRFAKYQGAGNDFVMVVDLDDVRPLEPDLVAAICDRRTGVGADGVIRLVRAARPDASFVMDYRNADGSPAEMCGNGARCVGMLVHDLGLTDASEFGIQTPGGVRRLRLHDDGGRVHRVTVEMGVAGLRPVGHPDARSGLGDLPRAAVRGGREA